MKDTPGNAKEFGPVERLVGPLEEVTFQVGGRQFKATVGEDGALRVYITGKRNGKMLVMP